MMTLYIACSVDGYIARTNGELDWLPEGEPSAYEAFWHTVETLVMGGKTYEQILTFGEWPYGDKPTYVVSRRSWSTQRNSIVFLSDPDALAAHCAPDRRLWLVGGSQMIRYYLQRGWVDEAILTIVPILLGSGIPLFTHAPETPLQLVTVTRYGDLVELHYRMQDQVKDQVQDPKGQSNG